MAWREDETEVGTVKLAGVEYPVNRVITQKSGLLDIPNKGHVQGEVWELARTEGEVNNPAFLLMDGQWIKGFTLQKRWAGVRSYPERQNVFRSDDGTIAFVVTSERITV